MFKRSSCLGCISCSEHVFWLSQIHLSMEVVKNEEEVLIYRKREQSSFFLLLYVSFRFN